MRRDEVIQRLLDLFTGPRYLEIGVSEGVTFHRVIAREKVAVDPTFAFDVDTAKRAHGNAWYHEVTSDTYFGSIVDDDDRFDVIYLDGLHTAEQTLRDILNATNFLTRGGIIAIDDVKPVTHLAAMADRDLFFKVRQHIGSKDKSWMGDVYKVVYFVDTFLQQFSHATVAENHGQAILWRKRRAAPAERGLAEIGTKRFEDLVAEIGVLRIKPFDEILAEIRAGLRLR